MKFVLFTLCAIGLLVDGAPSLTKEIDKSDYRLNTDVEPLNYLIELTPYFNNDSGKDAFTFDGNVGITLRTKKENVKVITLHKEELDIQDQRIVAKIPFLGFSWNIEPIGIDHVEYNEITKKYSIHLAAPLSPNQSYLLSFTYSGKLRTDMKGFYRSSYKEGNVTKWLASTQMEPVHARKVFPCFDEPRFKATFKLIMNRPSAFQPTISNTPIRFRNGIKDGITRETFATTPIMSTYLLAFVVSEFKCRDNAAETFQVCSRPNAFNQTEYSFDVGQKVLEQFDKLFDNSYDKHMSKMSMLAIPDFSAGAMENWGLLTFRETALLYDPAVSTAMNQQRVAAVVAHEQAHMWFGDLVTCDWWSNAWLNEGFARFFQYFGTALVESNWGLDQQFVVEQLQTVFGADSLEDTRPLSDEVFTPDEIADRFGSISYNKGASVIRMLEHAVGHNRFISALRNYLKTNALSTSVPEKLYAAFQEAIGNDFNVTDVLGSWVSQPGYPVLFVNVSSDRKSAEITQRRFLRNKPTHNDDTLWHVPITYATDKTNADFSSTKTTAALKSESLKIDLGEAVEWLILNVQQTGYYRVNYDDGSWSALARELRAAHSKIHVVNRAQIVDDALNLARAEQHNYKIALNTLEYLTNETDYLPWLSAFNNFDYILARFKSDESSEFQAFILELLNTAYTHLGFQPKQNDTRLDTYNRNNVLKYACQFGHKQCIHDARAEFDKLLQGNTSIPVNLSPVVYCTVVSHGSEKEWDHLWTKFQSENVAAEQVNILNALGCTKQNNLTQKYFDIILSDSIRLQDKHAALVSNLKHQENVNLVLDFVISKHKEITEIFETEKEVPSVLSLVARRVTTQEQINRIQKFANERDLMGNINLVTDVVNSKHNLKWAEKNIPIIKEYLHERSSAMAHAISYITLVALVCLTVVQSFN